MLATDDPAVLQAASAILGYATNKTIGKDGQTGAALAQYGTKWNELQQYSGWSENDKYNLTRSAQIGEQFLEGHTREIEKIVKEYVKEINIKQKPDLSRMPGDYMTFSVSIGEGVKAASIECIIDKLGQIYASAAVAPGASIGVPVNAGTGFLPLKDRNNASNNDYKSGIEGWYGSLTAQGVIGGTIGVSSSVIPVIEINVGGKVELGFSIGKTWYIGNLRELENE